jgi:hypothetical protein
MAAAGHRNSVSVMEPTLPPAPDQEAPVIEHLVTWQEDGGHVVVLGLDESCRPAYLTTLYSYL